MCFDCIGSDQPTIKDLNNLVVPSVGSKWYNLGIQLLDQQCIEMLRGLRDDNKNVEYCCTEMLFEWIKTTVDTKNATWEKLIEGLNSPSVKLYQLANTLQDMLLKPKHVCVCRVYLCIYAYIV